MGTFSGLTTSFTALTAARTAIEVAGQNIANVKTDGYTRQRAELVSNHALGSIGLLAPPRAGVGQGVTVSGIARLADETANRQVRAGSASAGYHAERAAALSELEARFAEPGDTSISSAMQEFWASWQDLSNATGDGASAAVVLERARVLADRIAAGATETAAQWTSLRGAADTMVSEVNATAERVAELNDAIRRTALAGGNVNELLDERDRLTGRLAELAGGEVHAHDDGTVDVLIAGNPLVSGAGVNRVALAGPTTPGTQAVALEWERRPGTPIGLDGGALGGALSMLAPASGAGGGAGSGGPLAETLAAYDRVATELATQVNAVHRTGVTKSGATGVDFFTLDPGVAPALALRVIPTGVDGIAAAAPGSGALDGTIADRISQLGTGAGAPDVVWAGFVTGVGVTAGAEYDRSALADLRLDSAVARQQSQSSVDLDEENMNLVLAQTAYQGAARVFTAIDEMLDTLINRTGTVGR
jgi:flagellar hook-associated protein 1 FlgK